MEDDFMTSSVLAQFSGKHKYTNDEVLKQRCFQVCVRLNH